jgi:hypothetical protein
VELYSSDHRFTTAAAQIDDEVVGAIAPIFEKWVKAGASIRGLSHIAALAVMTVELEFVLGWRPGQEKTNESAETPSP